MQLGLEGKVVLVTGGTRGIGLAIVRGFLAEGATVHFCSRTAVDIEEVTVQLTADFASSKAIGRVVDVSQPSQLKDWVSQCVAADSHIDVVVANVSALTFDDTPEDWQMTFEVDLMGAVNLLHAATPHLENSKGAIVNISSVSARDIDCASPGPYGALKAALIHYTSQLAHELAPKGVRANCVSPGNTYTVDGIWGQIERGNPEEFKEELDKSPRGRMARPEEVADAVVWLASERASFVSGTNLTVDGAQCTGVQY